MFRRLGYINDQLYEVELAKSEIENKETIVKGFFSLHYAKLRLLELYYNCFTIFCDTDKYEETEMDTDSLYSALAEKELFYCIRNEKRQDWGLLHCKDSKDSFTEETCSEFLPQTCFALHKRHDKREHGLFKEEFRCTDMRLCSKPYCCCDALSNKFKISSKGLNGRTFEDSGEGPLAKYQKVLVETENITSTNPGFRIKTHCVATYEKTKKELFFYKILNQKLSQTEIILSDWKCKVFIYEAFVQIYTL